VWWISFRTKKPIISTSSIALDERQKAFIVRWMSKVELLLNGAVFQGPPPWARLAFSLSYLILWSILIYSVRLHENQNFLSEKKRYHQTFVAKKQ
jgi:hypothetical protein